MISRSIAYLKELFKNQVFFLTFMILTIYLIVVGFLVSFVFPFGMYSCTVEAGDPYQLSQTDFIQQCQTNQDIGMKLAVPFILPIIIGFVFSQGSLILFETFFTPIAYISASSLFMVSFLIGVVGEILLVSWIVMQVVNIAKRIFTHKSETL